MATETFFLRNMLSQSCIRLLELYFERAAGVEVKSVQLGELTLDFDPAMFPREAVIEGIRSLGFELLKDPNVEIAEKAKIAAIEIIHDAGNLNSIIRNSDYIADKLQMPYDRISKIFSQVSGTTLERYIILLKIEKAKELVAEGRMTLSEISYQLGYSSVQYLSNQFKKITGITVSQFKENPAAYRKSIHELV